MIVGIVLYFMITAAILLFDGLFVYTQAKKSNRALFCCNLLRYVRPVEILLSLFSVIMLELVASERGMLTSGFVGYTAIILAVIAGVYLAELGIKEYKLNKMTMVISNIPRRELMSQVAESEYKYHYDDLYMTQGEIDRINALSSDKDRDMAIENGEEQNNQNASDGTEAKPKKVKKKASPIKIYMMTRIIIATFMLIVMIVSIVALTMVVVA